jgi:hypothetical protein
MSSFASRLGLKEDTVRKALWRRGCSQQKVPKLQGRMQRHKNNKRNKAYERKVINKDKDLTCTDNKQKIERKGKENILMIRIV